MKGIFVTLFPDLIKQSLPHGLMHKALQKGLVSYETVDMRKHSQNAYGSVDDTPYGGGPGQLVRVDVLDKSLKEAKSHLDARHSTRVIALDPAGILYTQSHAKRLSQYDQFIFLCGRYEGFDARIYTQVDEIISIGDYVLMGGELGALVIFETVSRLMPGVLGNPSSFAKESHEENLLEHSQYTRPALYEEQAVPFVYQNGHHAEIAKARRIEQLYRTKCMRPDLFAQLELSLEEHNQLNAIKPGTYFWDRK